MGFWKRLFVSRKNDSSVRSARFTADELIVSLKDPDGAKRKQAVVELHRYPGEATVSALASVLKDEDPELRAAAAESLRLLRDPRAVHALVEVLETDTDHIPVYSAIKALGYIRTAESTAALVSALDRGKADAVALALELGEARATAAVEPLLRLLREGTPAERKQAVTALARIGDIRTLEPLAGALDDPDEGVRNRAQSVIDPPGRRLWCAICGDWADASFSQEEPRTCSQCGKQNVTEMKVPPRFRPLDACEETIPSDISGRESSGYYVNIPQGSEVPVSGRYKCAWCGVLTVATDGSLEAMLAASSGAQRAQRSPTVRSFKAGDFFSMCDRCGPATGWTLLE